MTVVIFLLVGVLTMIGILRENNLNILSNLSAGHHGGIVGGLGGILAVLMIAGFSFQGTEIVGIAAGESENLE